MKGEFSTCEKCGSRFERTTRRSRRFCSQDCQIRLWVSHNRDKHNAAVRKYRKRKYEEDGSWLDRSPKASALKAWMIELKDKPCQDCGGKFPTCCMDFDHREGTTKSYNVGSMFAHHYARELIETEIVKCDLVCANCHRIRTRNRRTGSGLRTVPKAAQTGT